MNDEGAQRAAVEPDHSRSGDEGTTSDASPPLRAYERFAIALLAAGCLSGLGFHVWRDWMQPVPASPPSQQMLQDRIRELEHRLLETEPCSIERNYADL
jgi:hypothetical protein